METSADSSLPRWSTPECPFTVEYVPRVLDDIRLAVVDAFFSLPRGGAEIGGILLGRQESGRVVISDAIPLDCEHAFGPGFTLSDTDQAQLGVKLAEAAKAPNSKPVGWYHSHTRSDIFFSDADLDIHKRFFPEPWQVALVLKPHTFLPMRAGFFFQSADGSMRTDATYREFQIDPLPLGKVPAEEPSAKPAPVPGPPPAAGRVIDISRAARPESAAEPEHSATSEPLPTPGPQETETAPAAAIAAPSFGMEEQAPSRRWLVPVAVVAGLGLGAAGFMGRQLLMPKQATLLPAGIVAQASVGLTTTDRDGQLQIKWDPKAPDLQRSTGAMLLVTDGAQPRSIALDTAQLKTGSYAYKRNSDRVDIILSLGEPGGDKLVQAAGFVKPATAPAAAAPASPAGKPADAAVREERDALRGEVAGLKAANSRLTEANKRMERYIETDRSEHQRKRMENQAPEGK